MSEADGDRRVKNFEQLPQNLFLNMRRASFFASMPVSAPETLDLSRFATPEAVASGVRGARYELYASTRHGGAHWTARVKDLGQINCWRSYSDSDVGGCEAFDERDFAQANTLFYRRVPAG